MNSKQQNQLNKAYSKKLRQLNKSFFKSKETGLILFVEYLKYIRDCYVLDSIYQDTYTSTSVAALIAAIAEFDAYKKYREATQKRFHWNNFCELVKLNMEEWLAPNDPV